MRLSYWFASALGAVALAFVAMPTAQAAPTGAVTGNAAAVQDVAKSGVEQVRKRCYWHRGHRHCNRYKKRHYRHYGYAPYFGPSFGFYIGPKYRSWHGHRHHRHHRHHRWH